MKTNDEITNAIPKILTDADQEEDFITEPQDYANYTKCICSAIRRLRQKYYVQSQELATKLGINNSNYSRLERGQVSTVSEATIQQILNFYKIDTIEFKRLVDLNFSYSAVRSHSLPNPIGARTWSTNFYNMPHPFSIYHYQNFAERIFRNESILLLLRNRNNTRLSKRGMLRISHELFYEIPIFSTCEVVNSRVFFKGFIGKTYITRKLYVNNLQHGLCLAGILKDGKISLVSKASSLKQSSSTELNDPDENVIDEYGRCLLSDQPYTLQLSDNNSATEKYFNTYDYDSLSSVSLEVFLTFFKGLIHSELAEQKPLIARLHDAYDFFEQQDLETCMKNCMDLFVTINCDSCSSLFRRVYRDSLRKYYSLDTDTNESE